jgi:hypothetical protein
MDAAQAAAQVSPPTIHEAELAPGPSGGVLRGSPIDLATAIARRQAGENIVVCGNDLDANRTLAQQIEAAVGPYRRGVPHTFQAGPNALPHFQQVDSNHTGHSFYETTRRRARKKP